MAINESIAPERPCDQVDMGGTSAPILDHEWQVIRTELGQRRTVALRRMLLERRIDVRKVDDFLSTSSRHDGAEAKKEELSGILLPIWDSLAARPVDCVLLSVFMYARCHSVWELNGDHERIEVGIQGLMRSWKRAALIDSPAWLAVDLVVVYAQSLLPCARVEDALKCSCPVAMAFQASLITTECGSILGRSAELSCEWAGFRKEFLIPVLRTHQLTYHSFREAADSVTAWAVQGRAAAPVLEHAIQVIEQAQSDPDVAIDLYVNELRAHREGLGALHARITDPNMPDLRIKHGKIVYCYPFFIPHRIGHKVCEQAEQLPPRSLGQGRAFTVAKTELSDIWDAQEKHEAQYSGVTIALPDLEVETTGGDVLSDHVASIRLSRLGNHYIRIERSINDCTLHELNQAMRRAAPYMGLETITEVGGSTGPWRQIPTGYVRDLAAQFRALVRSENDPWNGDSPAALVTDADFHVVVEITAATVINDDGLCRPATTGDILTAAGPLLSATLQRLPSTLEEWARFGSLFSGAYGLPSNLADDSFALPGDFIGQTLNSTFIVMLNTPNWAILEHEERAEFVASLRPLIEGWRKSLTDLIKVEQKGELSSLDSGELLKRRQKLQDQVRRVQNDLALLHSIDLWKTLSSRRIGESLYRASGLVDAEAELKQTITQVELYYERMAVLISQKEEHHDRRYRQRVEVTLSIVGLLSVADLFSLVNQLFGFVGRIPALVEAGISVVAVAIVIALMVYKGRDRT